MNQQHARMKRGLGRASSQPGYVQRLRESVGHELLVIVGTSVLLFDQKDRVLLARRAETGHWGVPGGALEPGESFEEAARREIREELGLALGRLDFLGVYSGPAFFHTYPNGDRAYHVGVAYSASGSSEAPHPDMTEIVEAAFFGRNEVPRNLAESGRRVLRLHWKNLRVTALPATNRP